MRDLIRAELARIEADEDVRVLYAVESGSRAWGFASTDSDWDVRFIYVRRPDWYLSIERRRDVLEYPLRDDLDVSGWDLPKALRLFARSNPPLLEWLRSPIVYQESSSATAGMRELATRYFRPRASLYHYLHMAKGNYRDCLQTETVRTKKYFYVLRPVLACRWVEAHGTQPPTEFDHLVADQLPPGLLRLVEDLLARKRAGDELGAGPAIVELNEFLNSECHRIRAALADGERTPAPERAELDRVFRDTLREVWGSAG